MTAAGRPSIWPKPVTTPSAGVSRPFIDGAMLAWVASAPISWNDPASKSRSRRSRTVTLPSACFLATPSGPPISGARSRRARRSSASSLIPMTVTPDSALHDRDAVGVDPGGGGRAADHGDHGRGLAAVMGRVIDHVLEQGPEGDAELLAQCVLVH